MSVQQLKKLLTHPHVCVQGLHLRLDDEVGCIRCAQLHREQNTMAHPDTHSHHHTALSALLAMYHSIITVTHDLSNNNWKFIWSHYVLALSLGSLPLHFDTWPLDRSGREPSTTPTSQVDLIVTWDIGRLDHNVGLDHDIGGLDRNMGHRWTWSWHRRTWS